MAAWAGEAAGTEVAFAITNMKAIPTWLRKFFMARAYRARARFLEQIGQLAGQLRYEFRGTGAAKPAHFPGHVGLVGEAGIRGQIRKSRVRNGGDELEQTLEAQYPLQRLESISEVVVATASQRALTDSD